MCARLFLIHLKEERRTGEKNKNWTTMTTTMTVTHYVQRG